MALESLDLGFVDVSSMVSTWSAGCPDAGIGLVFSSVEVGVDVIGVVFAALAVDVEAIGVAFIREFCTLCADSASAHALYLSSESSSRRSVVDVFRPFQPGRDNHVVPVSVVEAVGLEDVKAHPGSGVVTVGGLYWTYAGADSRGSGVIGRAVREGLRVIGRAGSPEVRVVFLSFVLDMSWVCLAQSISMASPVRRPCSSSSGCAVYVPSSISMFLAIALAA